MRSEAGRLATCTACCSATWRLRLGLWFTLLSVALVAAPLWLGDGSPFGGTAFLGPGLAVWVSEPAADPATSGPFAAAPSASVLAALGTALRRRGAALDLGAVPGSGPLMPQSS